MAQIAYFAKLHQFDDRQTYKTHWTRWFSENQISLEAEIQRLTANGYTGDVNEKMYKAGRYYFRKKKEDEKEGQDEKEGKDGKDEKERQDVDKPPYTSKKYITMSKGLLAEMDKHIVSSIENDRTYTPAKGYTVFCERYVALLAVETARLILATQLNDTQIIAKIKKTYKNRYFIVTR
jgi:hypothetical protein